MIAGGGLIGKGLAQRLVQQKHDVVVIDQDPNVCEEIYAKYGAISIQGNATDLETLESAGIERCEVAVAAMRNDADNLAFALLAKGEVEDIQSGRIDTKLQLDCIGDQISLYINDVLKESFIDNKFGLRYGRTGLFTKAGGGAQADAAVFRDFSIDEIR